MASSVGRVNEAYVHAYYQSSKVFKKYWIENHPEPNDPFGTREPSTDDRRRIGHAWINRHSASNKHSTITDELMKNRLINATPIARPTAIDPLAYEDILAMQHQLQTNTGEMRNSLSLGELNREMQVYLENNYPDDEAFLKRMSRLLGTSPIETIIKCIQSVQKANSQSVEETTLNNINDELKKLEKEKANG